MKKDSVVVNEFFSAFLVIAIVVALQIFVGAIFIQLVYGSVIDMELLKGVKELLPIKVSFSDAMWLSTYFRLLLGIFTPITNSKK